VSATEDCATTIRRLHKLQIFTTALLANVQTSRLPAYFRDGYETV
jgi:hypothetical protein